MGWPCCDGHVVITGHPFCPIRAAGATPRDEAADRGHLTVQESQSTAFATAEPILRSGGKQKRFAVLMASDIFGIALPVCVA